MGFIYFPSLSEKGFYKNALNLILVPYFTIVFRGYKVLNQFCADYIFRSLIYPFLIAKTVIYKKSLYIGLFQHFGQLTFLI